MKSKKTNRKFYNKWLYKISLSVEGAYNFRIHNHDELKILCSTDNIENKRSSYIFRDVKRNDKLILSLIDFLDDWDRSLWSRRIERSCVDLYTNEKAFYEEVSEKFKDDVIHRFEPEENSLEKLENSYNTIMGKKLPHDRYQFRVYLLPHKMKGDKEGKIRYVNWLKTQCPRVTCTTAIEEWFLKTDWNWDRRYILVEDDQTLLMLKLRNSEVVGKIYNYQIYDK
jgi:hypothetical protein